MPSPTNNHLPTARNTTSWLLLITANTLWAASYVAAKLALQDASVNVMLALRMGISALLLLPFLMTSASIVVSMLFWTPIAAWEILGTGWHPIGLVAWLSIAWMAIMSTVVAYLAWFKGLAKVDGSTAASTLFIQPLLGTFLAIVLLHDQLTTMTVVGGILIIVSVYLISRN